MKILFVWTGLTSYMGDCWRRFAAMPDVQLKVVVAVRPQDGVAFKAEGVLRGLDYEIVEEGAVDVDGLVARVAAWSPDVAFVVGWHSRVCRAFVEAQDLAAVPKVCCFDMPWRWKMRCLVAPFILGRFLRQYKAAFVPGEFCARYAKWLGFRRIYRGLFGIDTMRFADTAIHDAQQTVRTKDYFLYVGRNSSEKRLDDLRAAHALYRSQGGMLDLRMFGKGLPNGFVSPEEVPGLMQGAAAFVLASDFDPWPLVLIEAMSAGCRVVASDKCTNWPELGKNWKRFRCGDVKALAKRMLEVEEETKAKDHPQELNSSVSNWRMENLELARQYDCVKWAERVVAICEEVRK